MPAGAGGATPAEGQPNRSRTAAKVRRRSARFAVTAVFDSLFGRSRREIWLNHQRSCSTGTRPSASAMRCLPTRIRAPRRKCWNKDPAVRRGPGGTLSNYLGQGGHVELLQEVSRRRFRQRALHVLLLQPADPGDTAASQCLDRGQVHAAGQAVYRDRSGVGRRARAAYRPSHHS